MHDRKRKGVWEIEVKWKYYEKTTWEPIKNIKHDQPDIVEQYMNKLCKKKTALKSKKKTKTKVIAPNKKVGKRCKKKHDIKSSYKIEEDIRCFTVNGKKHMME